MAIKRQGWPTPEGERPATETTGYDSAEDPELGHVPGGAVEYDGDTQTSGTTVFDGEEQGDRQQDRADASTPPAIIQIFVPREQAAAFNNKAKAKAEAPHEGEDMGSETPVSFNTGRTSGAPEAFTADQGQSEGGQSPDIAEGSSGRGLRRFRRAPRVSLQGSGIAQTSAGESPDASDRQTETPAGNLPAPIGTTDVDQQHHLPAPTINPRPVQVRRATVVEGVRKVFDTVVAESGMSPNAPTVSLLATSAESLARKVDAEIAGKKFTIRESVKSKIGDEVDVWKGRAQDGTNRVVGAWLQTDRHPVAINIATNYVREHIDVLRENLRLELTARSANETVESYIKECIDNGAQVPSAHELANMAVAWSDYIYENTDWSDDEDFDELKPLTPQDILSWPSLDGDETLFLITNRAARQFRLAVPVVRHTTRLNFDGSPGIRTKDEMGLREQLDEVPDSTEETLLIPAPDSGNAAVVKIVPVSVSAEIGKKLIGDRSRLSALAVTPDGKSVIHDAHSQEWLRAFRTLHPDSKEKDPNRVLRAGVQIYDQMGPADTLELNRRRMEAARTSQFPEVRQPEGQSNQRPSQITAAFRELPRGDRAEIDDQPTEPTDHLG